MTIAIALLVGFLSGCMITYKTVKGHWPWSLEKPSAPPPTAVK